MPTREEEQQDDDELDRLLLANLPERVPDDAEPSDSAQAPRLPLPPRQAPAGWLIGCIFAVTFAGMVAAMFGGIVIGPLMIFAGMALMRRVDPQSASATFVLIAMGVGLAMMSMGAIYERRELQLVAYKAHRSAIGCENADLYSASRGSRHFAAGPPDAADIARCSPDEDLPDPWQDFTFDLERAGWPKTYR